MERITTNVPPISVLTGCIRKRALLNPNSDNCRLHGCRNPCHQRYPHEKGSHVMERITTNVPPISAMTGYIRKRARTTVACTVAEIRTINGFLMRKDPRDGTDYGLRQTRLQAPR